MVRIATLFLIALLLATQLLPHRRRAGTGSGPTCDGPPFYQDFTTLTTGDLDGQGGWDDKSGATGEFWQVLNGEGVCGQEPGWSQHYAAIDTQNCTTTNTAQWVSFIFNDVSGSGGGGRSFGACARANAVADTFIWCEYDEGSGIYLGVQKGTQSTQYTWSGSLTLSDGDSITMTLSGTQIYVYQNSTQRITYSDAGVLNSGTGTRLGISCIGDGTAGWYIQRWRGGNF